MSPGRQEQKERKKKASTGGRETKEIQLEEEVRQEKLQLEEENSLEK